MRNRIAFFLLLAAVLIGPLLFGAVHTYAYSFVFLMILGAGLGIAWSNIERSEDVYCYKCVKTGMIPLFLGMIFLLFIQMLSMPDPLLVRLSPEAKVAGDTYFPAGWKESWHALAVYIFPVRMSLVRWIVYGILFWGLIQVLNTRKRIELAILFILALCCFEVVYGIFQTQAGSNRIWWFENVKPVQTDKSVNGTYINRNHFAGLMEMGVVLVIAYIGALTGRMKEIRGKTRRDRVLGLLSSEKNLTRFILLFFSGVIMILGLFLSGSRGGIIALIGAVFVMGLLMFFRKERRRFGLIMLILFGLGAVYATAAGTDYTAGRFMKMGPEYENRLRYTQNTINLCTDHILAGVGVGNYTQAFAKWQSPADKHFSMDYTHNDWIQFAAEAGILGLLILAGGMAFYLFTFLKKWKARDDPFAVSLGIAPLGAMTAIGIHSYSDFNLHIPANFMMLTAIMAIGWSALHLEKHRGGDRTVYPCYSFPLRKGGIAVAALAALMIVWSGIWTVRHFVAEAYCPTEQNSTLKLDENPPAERIRKAIVWAPANAEYRFKLARELMRTRDREVRDSGLVMERWHEWTPQIIAALEDAIRLNPWKAEYHRHLGWQYSYLWTRPDYNTKWLPAADAAMERASYRAGAFAENPHMLADMGNYWTMRSKNLDPSDPRQEVAWTKAVWNYRKALEMDKRRELSNSIAAFVRNFYPDEEHLKQVMP